MKIRSLVYSHDGREPKRSTTSREAFDLLRIADDIRLSGRTDQPSDRLSDWANGFSRYHSVYEPSWSLGNLVIVVVFEEDSGEEFLELWERPPVGLLDIGFVFAPYVPACIKDRHG